MTKQKYLQSLLEEQKLSENQIANLKGLRNKIQLQLEELDGNPIFYYAGSYAKKNMIAESYDLDIVIYWPHDAKYSLEGIFNRVGKQLKKYWNNVNKKTVAWNLPFKGNFHIDVVPGRAIDSTYKYANLYKTDTGTLLKTSLKIHIESVRNSNRRDTIKLMKLWKTRKKIPFKTFVLEQVVIEGCKGKPFNEYEPQLNATFNYIYNHILTARIIDPANQNNVISDSMTSGDKTAVRNAAKAAIDARTWSDVFE